LIVTLVKTKRWQHNEDVSDDEDLRLEVLTPMTCNVPPDDTTPSLSAASLEAATLTTARGRGRCGRSRRKTANGSDSDTVGSKESSDSSRDSSDSDEEDGADIAFAAFNM